MLALLLAIACHAPVEKDTVEVQDTGSDTDTVDTVDTAPAPDPLPALEGALTATNSIGRHGAFYLPEGYNVAPLPILLGFHGTGGQGADMISIFRTDAANFHFGLVAPDSRISPDGQYTWEVANAPAPFTEDLTFAQTCLDEVLAMDGVALDAAHLLAAGFSGGGSSAPYLATNDDRFTACAVLHGGVFPGGLGDNVIPCWFSTGTDDTIRSPAHVQDQMAQMEAAGYPDVEYHEFPGSHELGPEERTALETWWLGQTRP